MGVAGVVVADTAQSVAVWRSCHPPGHPAAGLPAAAAVVQRDEQPGQHAGEGGPALQHKHTLINESK